MNNVARYRQMARANPEMPESAPQFPAQSAYDHGRTMAGIGYTRDQAQAVHSRSHAPDMVFMWAGYDSYQSGQ